MFCKEGKRKRNEGEEKGKSKKNIIDFVIEKVIEKKGYKSVNLTCNFLVTESTGFWQDFQAKFLKMEKLTFSIKNMPHTIILKYFDLNVV